MKKIKTVFAAFAAMALAFMASAAMFDLSQLPQADSCLPPKNATLTGRLLNPIQVNIRDGAEITLKNVTIDGSTFHDSDDKNCHAGLTCQGDATIILEGNNKITSFNRFYPGIYVPEGHTLTIKGSGSLVATGMYQAAGIGGGTKYSTKPGPGKSCGDIYIQGGNITAYGGQYAAGIGGGHSCTNGNITITGGTITAKGDDNAAGIGGGSGGSSGFISIQGGTITANGGINSAGIGSGNNGGTCTGVKILSGINKVTAIRGKGGYMYAIGRSNTGSCDGVSIADGLINDRTQTTTDGRMIHIVERWNGDLYDMACDATAFNNTVITGWGDHELNKQRRITIADGATVCLSNAWIRGYKRNTSNDDNYQFAGITCLGNATIILDGTNIVSGFHSGYPGIYVKPGKTLTIKGTGELQALGNGRAAGIGAGSEYMATCGNIRIEGGVIKAYSNQTFNDVAGEYAAAIGGAYNASCGNITILNSTVTAVAGKYAAGIGGGNFDSYNYLGCGNIDIRTSSVTATGGQYAAGIGGGCNAFCGSIKIGYGEISGLRVVATHGGSSAEAIGCGLGCKGGMLTKGNPYLSDGTDGATRTIAYWNGNLSTLTGDVVAYSGLTITGTLSSSSKRKVSIAAGASVTLNNVTIAGDYSTTGASGGFAGLTCLSNAVIQIKGSNTVKGFGSYYPGIYVPEGSKLTMYGSGRLTAGSSSGNEAAGIGAGRMRACGSITLQSGTITAYGGSYAAGIGGAYDANCGNIEITGGTITSTGGGYGAGIGSGAYASCGSVAITGGSVTSAGGEQAAGIGSGHGTSADPASCGAISIGAGIVSVRATCGMACNNPIGAGVDSTCGSVTVASTLSDSTVSATRTITHAAPQWNGNLSTLTGDATAVAGTVIYGTLGGNYKVSIAAGATVTLSNATINGSSSSSYKWAGITCLGDATINLAAGTVNTVKGFYEDYPGISVPLNKTLTIQGKGSLDASSNGWGAGIGGGYDLDCGNIYIVEGTVRATGGKQAAGIGGGCRKLCGNIVIGGTTADSTGGATVYATGGNYGAGIGGGPSCTNGYITIYAGTVYATGGVSAAGIGSGSQGVSRSVRVFNDANFTHVTATCGSGCVNPIGAGSSGSCGAEQISNELYDDRGSPTRAISSEWPSWDGDLSSLTHDARAADGTVIRGTLAGGCKVCIEDGATITLSNVRINADGSQSGDWAGIACLGDATIILADGSENIVKAFNTEYPGIFVPEGYTLTILGTGSLTASAKSESSMAAGIGGGCTTAFQPIHCGSISIEGGTVTAIGGLRSAGIGGAYRGRCGDITIGAGIMRVVATYGVDDGEYQAEPIGSGLGGHCGTVTIDPSLTDDNGSPIRTVMSWNGDLSTLDGDVTIERNMTLYGTLTTNVQVSIAYGVTVTLSNATITCCEDGENITNNWAGLTCEGDATIILEGANQVKGFYEDNPGIYVPVGSTLTIRGSGSLTAYSNGYGAGIGGGFGLSCGNIVIEDGVINAIGGTWSAGIGGGGFNSSGSGVKCGYIEINGGDVTAQSGGNGAGIGGGAYGTCGDITIGAGIVSVVAQITGGGVPIGAGQSGSCGTVTVASGLHDDNGSPTRTITSWDGDLSSLEGSGEVTAVNGTIIRGTLASDANYKINIAAGAMVVLENAIITRGNNTTDTEHAGLSCLGDATIILEGSSTVKGFATGYPGIHVPSGYTLIINGDGSLTAGSITGYAAGIGGGYKIACGNIDIEGGTIISTGSYYAAGIGGGYDASCGNITIGAGVTSVRATCGTSSSNPIGAAYGSPTIVEIAVAEGLINSLSLDGKTRTIARWDGNLAALTDDVIAFDDTVIYGTLGGNYKVSIAAGATVTLSNAVINGANGSNYTWAGITCLGDAEIILADGSVNTVKGFYSGSSGVYVPVGSTLTIGGNGSLIASSAGDGAGIGAGYTRACGNILIEGGVITATGGSDGAGIGAAHIADCGDITISGGIVDAIGGSFGAGIGGGGYGGDCGNITISGGTVTAVGMYYAAGIGGGGSESGGQFESSDCGDITIGFGITSVSATRGSSCDNAIGAGYRNGDYGECGTITIEPGLTDDHASPTRTITPTPPWDGDLAALTDDVTIDSDMTICGTLGGNYKISVADGATVTLSNALINADGSLDGNWAGITCLGDAEIVLAPESVNTVKGLRSSGIYVPAGKTLTISGTGTLNAIGTNSGAGIGADYEVECGSIVIEDGTIFATGAIYGAAIGGSFNANCGTITINGGTVNATAGNSAAAIGSGRGGSCEGVMINGGTVVATGDGAAGIGTGYAGVCGAISITGGDVNATSGYFSAGIGGGNSGSCGAISITGGTVAATGHGNSAGIGGGTSCGVCGAITIGAGITRVVATCGDSSSKPIGEGNGAAEAPVTVGSGLYDDFGCPIRTISSTPPPVQHVTIDGATWYYRVLGGTSEIYNEDEFGMRNPAVSPAPSGALEIPATLGGYTVTAIGVGAFAQNQDLTSVIIPDGVTSIGDYAFYANSSLESVTIPDSVDTIGYRAFGYSGLNTLYVGRRRTDEIKTMLLASGHEAAFVDAITFVEPVSSVRINDNGVSFTWYYRVVSSNGVNCVEVYNNGLCAVTPAGSVLYVPTTIGGLPIASFGESALDGWSGLTTVYYDYSNTRSHVVELLEGCGIDTSGLQILKRGYVAYSTFGLIYAEDEEAGTATILEWYPIGEGATEVTIPETVGGATVTAIGDGAFAGQDGITSITIPDTVSSIGDGVFDGCSSLTTINAPANLVDDLEDSLEDAGLNGVTINSTTPEDPYQAWAAANGVTGAWDALGADGVANVFRYIFGMTDFSSTPLITISFDASGNAVITTPEVKTTEGYEVRIKATDDVVDITGNYSTALLEVGDTCKTFIEPEKTKRFFRLVVDKN